MKIAIASSGKNLESQVDPRFGRCPYLLIIDSKTGEFEAIGNRAGQAFRGAGVSAAQTVVNKGAGVVIAGNFGPNAVNVLKASRVKIFTALPGITIKEALKTYQEGKLNQVTQPIRPGIGRGWGRGGGGRGRV